MRPVLLHVHQHHHGPIPRLTQEVSTEWGKSLLIPTNISIFRMVRVLPLQPLNLLMQPVLLHVHHHRLGPTPRLIQRLVLSRDWLLIPTTVCTSPITQVVRINPLGISRLNHHRLFMLTPSVQPCLQG